MTDLYTGYFTMYDVDSQVFIPPDETKTYAWPTQDFKVVDWNTWMRAFAYWMRDKFDFEISSGPGTSVGLVGLRRNRNINYSINPQISGIDNDWTSDDFGRYYIDDELWRTNRAESPFRPYSENGVIYYGEEQDGEIVWTGKWNGSEIFDDKNKRFDVILSSSYFNNLGLRFKYPLTTTGVKYKYSPTEVTGHCEINNEYIIKPSITATLNKKQIIYLTDAGSVVFSNGYSQYYYNYDHIAFFPYYGIMTLLDGRRNLNYIDQYWSQYTSDNRFLYYGLNYSSVDQCYPWTPNFLTHVSNSNSLFLNSGLGFNKIKFFKSYNNDTLVISIVNDNNIIAAQFVFYKNLDNTSNLLIAEDRTWERNKSRTWYSSTDKQHRYWINKYIENNSSDYGNYGNLIVSSNNSSNFNNYVISPVKFLKDARDNNTGSLIDESGQWTLENFCGMPSSGTAGKNLYLVTKCGVDSLIGADKFLMGKIDNKVTKFLVFPFNGPSELETSTSYLMAIPIWQEE